MGLLHTDYIWEEYLRSYVDLDFFCTQRVDFNVFLCCPCVCNVIHMVIVGWFNSKVITLNSVLV